MNNCSSGLSGPTARRSRARRVDRRRWCYQKPLRPIHSNNFAPATRAGFAETFPSPTAVQAAAWAAIGAGKNALVIAPTGSGKTLAAFMQAIDQLFRERETPIESAASSPQYLCARRGRRW
ncbi:DEAD/DEAH box helicase [Pseudomonas sp. ZB1P45]|uniref:DEAD/DEAH box helicase n=1 Tax=Pseudomonas frigoris TaxID=3398356 RepID=UPI0039EFAA3C